MPASCFFSRLGDVDAFQQISARTGLVQASQNIHERGFAAAAGAHDGHKLATLDLETYAAQSVDLGFTQLVSLVNVICANDDFIAIDLLRRLVDCQRVGLLCAHGGSSVYLPRGAPGPPGRGAVADARPCATPVTSSSPALSSPFRSWITSVKV